MRNCGTQEIQWLIMTANAPNIGGTFRVEYDAWSEEALENLYVQNIPIHHQMLTIFNDPVRYPNPHKPACMAFAMCKMFPGTKGTFGFTTGTHEYALPYYYTGAGHVSPYTLAMYNTYWDLSGWPETHMQVCISHPTCSGITKMVIGTAGAAIVHYLDSGQLRQRDIDAAKTAIPTILLPLLYENPLSKDESTEQPDDTVRKQNFLNLYYRLKAPYVDGKAFSGYLLNRGHVSGDISALTTARALRTELEELYSIGGVEVTKDDISTLSDIPSTYPFPFEGCDSSGCYGHIWKITFLSNFGNLVPLEVSADYYNGFTYGPKAIACDDDRKLCAR